MRHLSVDIETFSSVDLKKSGLYKYAEAADFQLLLFAYSFDWGPVQLVDLTKDRYLPQEVLRHLYDTNTLKHAYNAAFEWYCLCRHFGIKSGDPFSPEKWLSQWRCTMLHELYCGYTAGLGPTGEALGLPQDKRKLGMGASLIRTFCVPTKPSAANGNRNRTFPHHEPERWELFKDYCRQDVVTEMDIARRLSFFPVPDEIQRQWEQDQAINLRGVAVDTEFVHAAIACNDRHSARLTDRSTAITGLENPKSVMQLTQWLKAELDEDIPNLQKKTVSKLLDKLDEGDPKSMLELRQELSKTSIKKYQAMLNTAGADGRARGLLQFYGANRTGRWAGRLAQVQNLPRTHIDMLPLAREQVKGLKLDNLAMIYGSPSSTLSQLIRTALVAPPGKRLISADFSAIEARVIAWLAKEQWRLDVFATHGKIYEASASQMFGVPLERIKKGNPEYELRQKGKVAELALGYGGSVDALKQMGGEDMGLTEEEMQDIVLRWRQASPSIKGMWYAVQEAALTTLNTGCVTSTHRCTFALEGDDWGNVFLTLLLPSGRKLYYVRPHMGVNRFNQPALCYWGMNQTSKKWQVTETWGGKLTENIVQAVARDCLSVALDRIEAAGYPAVFHVHDEIVCEVDAGIAEAALVDICAMMGDPISWAPGLLLTAAGYTSEFYRKD